MKNDNPILEAATWVKSGKPLDQEFAQQFNLPVDKLYYVRDQINMILEGFTLLPIELRTGIFLLAVMEARPGVTADDIMTYAVKTYISRMMRERLDSINKK